jgi:hypothetical protein
MEQGINSLKQRAYHEAGHVVIAYFAGYSCRSFEITEKSPLENTDKYDFGNDLNFIMAAYKYKDNPDSYDSLPQSAKNQCRNLALKAIIVMMGGSAAESVFKSGGKIESNPFFTISVHDLNGADNLDYFLSIVKQGQHPSNYLQSIFRQVLKLLETKEVWNAISALADAIIESEETKLERKDIEKTLTETGFLHYLSCMRKGQSPKPQQSSSPVTTEEKPPDQKTSNGFTREELEKMKQQCKKNPILNKKEGVVKIINFAKGMKYSNLLIGLTNDPEKDLYDSGKIDKNDQVNSLVFETSSYSVAKEIQMYFVCLGMEIPPGSSKSNDAATIYIMMK